MTRPPGGPGHRPRSAVHAALRHRRPKQLSHVGSSAITVRAPCSRRRGCRLRREGPNGRRTSACALTATPATARARSQSGSEPRARGALDFFSCATDSSASRRARVGPDPSTSPLAQNAVTNDVTPPLLTGFAGRDSSLVYGDTIALTLLLHPDPP